MTTPPSGWYLHVPARMASDIASPYEVRCKQGHLAKNGNNMQSILNSVAEEILSWPGTTQGTHRFGGVEFRAYGHEIGHLHGSRQADLPFPVRLREELVAAGRASPHHVLPQTGWVTFYIHGQDDVPALIELFRLSYDRIATAEQSRQGQHTETEQRA